MSWLPHTPRAAAALAAVMATGVIAAPFTPPGATAYTEPRVRCHHVASKDHQNWGVFGITAGARQKGAICYKPGGRHYARFDKTVLMMKVAGTGICDGSPQGFFKYLAWGPVLVGSKEPPYDVAVFAEVNNIEQHCVRASGSPHNLDLLHVSWKVNVPPDERRVRFRHEGPHWSLTVRPKCNWKDVCGDDHELREHILRGRFGPKDRVVS